MKKVSYFVLGLMNVLNICAAIYTQVILLLEKDFLSIISLKFLTTSELLYFNMIVFCAVCMLISVAVAILNNSDKSINEMKLFTGVPKFLIILDIIIFGVAFYNSLSLSNSELAVCSGIQIVHILITCFCGGSFVALKTEKE